MTALFRHRDATGVHVAGPWPFVTFRSYRLGHRRVFWRARQQRKGLMRRARALENAPTPFWQSRRYNWYVGAIFAVGSFLFMLGSALSLLPASAGIAAAAINIVFFLGSIPFTTAAYLQHFQAANASEFTLSPEGPAAGRTLSFIGWHPRNAGWLSTFTQFVGTVAFNVNTFDGILAPTRWYIEDVAIWVPDMIGSLLFLVSAYLAFIETAGAYWRWKPRDLAWQIVFVNLVGCVAFMIAAIVTYVPSGSDPAWTGIMGNAQLFLGALCFFIGSWLTMRESETAAP